MKKIPGCIVLVLAINAQGISQFLTHIERVENNFETNSENDGF